MGLISAQIIARSQSEISSKTDELINGITPSNLKTITVSPFGSNLFAILVTYDNKALPTMKYVQKALNGLKSAVSRVMSKTTTLKPKLGLGVEMWFTPHVLDVFAEVAKVALGFISSVAAVRGKPKQTSKGLNGLKSSIWARQAPTREKPLLGIKLLVRANQKPTRELLQLGILSKINYSKSGG
jgi:hypothetical protein